MAAHWLWWIFAAVMIGAELVTGTYYLFAIGAAMAIGGAAAFFGADMSMQFTVAGVLGVGLTALAHQWRARYATPPPQPPLDIGQPVQVRQWRADGTLRVAYRGSEWDAELASPATSRDRPLFIVAMRGSVLVVSDKRPAA
jgi:membrane protein implicated in regulation of membrane protease activity